MILYQKAQQLILSKAKSFGQEIIHIEKALGRVLAENVYADRDYPPFNRSAMDGIAVKFEDIENNIREFELLETIFAGQISELPLSHKQCYKIMTGAAVPETANLVIRNEDIHQVKNKFIIKELALKKYQNIALKGQDLVKGELVFSPSHIISAVSISILASLGKNNILVEKKPTVSIFTTGNEVIDINSNPSSVQIRNSNQLLLKSLLQKMDIEVAVCEHIEDDEIKLAAKFSKSLNHDIIIINGGVSAGDADFVPTVLEKLGVKKLFHKVAIKPGKPLWCGELPNGGMVFALPGNPFSCLVTFKLFLEPYLDYSYGLQINNYKKLPLNNQRHQKTKLDEFFPASIDIDGTQLQEIAINGSGDIRLGLSANALALHPSDKSILNSGELIGYLPI